VLVSDANNVCTTYLVKIILRETISMWLICLPKHSRLCRTIHIPE
jgi:hypothetical protein